MIDPSPGDEGRSVLYWQAGWPDPERGVISSWNEHYVFVRFGETGTAKATRREDLTFEARMD